MSEKKYSPQEAAIAVLKKTEELYKASKLAKGEWNKIHNKLESEGYSKKQADKIDGSIKAKVEKSDDMGSEMPMEMSDKNPDEKADAKLGEKVEREVESHEKTNSDPQHEMPMKGHLKLAKFMGRMEMKKSMKSKEMDKAETGSEKGVHLKSKDYAQGSDAGNKLRTWPKGKGQGYDKSPLVGQITDQAHSEAKESHKKVLGEMKQMPKPKLPG